MKPSYSLGICLTLLPLLNAQADDSALHPVTVTGTRAPTDLSSAPLIIDIIDRTVLTFGTEEENWKVTTTPAEGELLDFIEHDRVSKMFMVPAALQIQRSQANTMMRATAS